MNTRYFTLAAAIVIATLSFYREAPARELLYTLESRTTLSSSDTWWDYIKMQPGSNRLFIARVSDGLTVFDITTNEVLATIDNSKGANGPLLLPEFGRGYVAMTDGSLLSIDLQTLSPIERISLADDAGLNSAIYDPSTKRVYAISGRRELGAIWFSIDAATGEVLGRKVFPFSKMDDPATDGSGVLFAPARYDDLILTLDSNTLEELGRWEMPCHVSKVHYDKHHERLFAACLGYDGDPDPILLVIDPTNGKEVARLPIGKGLDAMVVDETRRRIITANGADGSLTVIQQNGPDSYELMGTVYTAIGARMMHIDQQSGRLLVVNADRSESSPDPVTGETETFYHPDSFAVLTYKPR